MMDNPAVVAHEISYLINKIMIYIRNSYHTHEAMFAHCFPMEYKGMISGGCLVTDWKDEFVKEMRRALRSLNKQERKLYLAMIYEDSKKFKKNLRVLLRGDPVPNLLLYIMGERDNDMFFRLRFYNEGREEAWKFLSEGEYKPKFLFLYALFLGRPLEEIFSLLSSVTQEEEAELNYSKNTAMFTAACLWGTLETVKYCVEHFGREMLETLSTSPLLMAGMLNRIDVLNYFLELGVDVNRPNDDDVGGTLSLICNRGLYDVVTLLVERGADIEVDTDTCLFVSPLSCACEARFTYIVKYLIDKGADITRLHSSYRDKLILMQKEAGWDLQWFIQKYLESYIKQLEKETPPNPSPFFVNSYSLKPREDIPRRELLVAAQLFLNVIIEPSEENFRVLFSERFTRALTSTDFRGVFDLFRREFYMKFHQGSSGLKKIP